MLNASQALTHGILTTIPQGCYYYPILYMRKLRLRKFKLPKVTQLISCKADQNPGIEIPLAMLLTDRLRDVNKNFSSLKCRLSAALDPPCNTENLKILHGSVAWP